MHLGVDYTVHHFLANKPYHTFFPNSTLTHHLQGFARSILLVFRTHTPYNRCPEGQ